MTNHEPESTEVRMTVPAISGQELVAAQAAASFAESAGADEATVGDIRMAVIEGCINAIEHAFPNGSITGIRNNCAPSEVDLKFQLIPADDERGRRATIRIVIRDAGCGFDLTKYEEPTLEKKLHSSRKRGWGLKLIRGFMDDLNVISGREGTTLEMSKRLATEAD